MRVVIRCALALVSAFAFVTPGLAQQTDISSNAGTPGSVIIFPKFIAGAGTAVRVDGATLPRTEIAIGVVCPNGATCPEHQSVQVHFAWVCPGAQTVAGKFACAATDFQVVLSINGKLAFSADGTPINSNSPMVPIPPCTNGYLIGWVINGGVPVKFDGLIGGAVLRGPNNPVSTASVNAGFSTAVSSYRAVTIQADPALATGAPIQTNKGNLVFDGGVGHYRALTGTLFGNVKFDNPIARATDPAPGNALSKTFLILLTIDSVINRPNNPVFVPLHFYNESLSTVSSTNPNFEQLTSTSLEFLCWTQIQLTQINANLTQAFQGTRNGTVIAGPAEKQPVFGINDQPFNCPNLSSPTCDLNATLLGLIHTIEGTAANNYQERGYISEMYNDQAISSTCFGGSPGCVSAAGG